MASLKNRRKMDQIAYNMQVTQKEIPNNILKTQIKISIDKTLKK